MTRAGVAMVLITGAVVAVFVADQGFGLLSPDQVIGALALVALACLPLHRWVMR